MTTHPNVIQGKTQIERLYNLLIDGEEHTTPEIMEAVYGGDKLGVARIAARVYDINERIKRFGYKVVSRKVSNTIWGYRIVAAE